MGVGFENTKAGVLELVDEVDSKSIASDGVRVRVPPPAPERTNGLDAVGGTPTASTVSGVFTPQIFRSKTIDANRVF